ncbi:hypothetical protein CALVIDRAFT_555244, partial [Calocera viscosa TUFC12733]
MTSPLHDRLTHEIWRVVLEEVVEREKRPRLILTLMHVCKAWKAIAQPLLYRHLHFYSDNCLIKFHRHLLSNALRGCYPGKGARTFRATFYGTTYHFHERLQSILVYMPNLEVFCPGTNWNNRVAVEWLAQTRGKSLKQLDANIWLGEDADLQIAVLGQFSVLEKLDIHMAEYKGQAPPLSDLHMFPAFEMSALTHLTLSGGRGQHATIFLTFVSRGLFPSLKELSLDLRTLGHITTGIRGTLTNALLPLFKNHSRLSHLSITSVNPDDSLRLISSLLPLLGNIHKVRIGSKPPQEVIGLLPTNIAELRLEANFHERDEMQTLLNCISHMYPSLSDLPSLKVIWVNSDDHDARPFEWANVDPAGDNADLFFQLMLYSVRFASKGVHIQDDNG